MKYVILLFSTLALAGCASSPPNPSAGKPARHPRLVAHRPVRVACIGDSITAGSGTLNRATDAYPIQLQRLLDQTNWQVRGFGVSGATLMNQGDKPYRSLPAFTEALAFAPDVVVVMLGTNDSKPQNWRFREGFVDEYRQLITCFKALPSPPRIFICLPIIVVDDGKYGVNGKGVEQELPLIEAVARLEEVDVIDLHAALVGHESLIPDHVHPDTEGAGILAHEVARALQRGGFIP